MDRKKWLAGVVVLCLCGCGGAPAGPKTYQLSGNVTYNGQPVPIGTVSLRPDPDQENKGPGADSGIQNGKYATEPGKGHVGGPYILFITGYDGVPVEGGEGMNTTGTEMFLPYEMRTELPAKDFELNIEVP